MPTIVAGTPPAPLASAVLPASGPSKASVQSLSPRVVPVPLARASLSRARYDGRAVLTTWQLTSCPSAMFTCPVPSGSVVTWCAVLVPPGTARVQVQADAVQPAVGPDSVS